MRKTVYWQKIIYYPVAEDVDLELCLHKVRGKLETFSVIFRYNIDGRWRTVKRCDNAKLHGGIPHCHIFKLNSKESTEIVGTKKDDMGVIAAAIIGDLKLNYPKVVENYKFNH